MKIYRLEHASTGQGPYQGNPIPEMSSAHFNMTHPSPQVDPAPVDGIHRQTMTYAPGGSRDPIYVEPYTALGIDFNEFCGLTSKKKVKEWFAGYGTALEEEDFVVAEYDAPKSVVRVGSKQVVFRKHRAKLVATHSPREMIGA